MSVYFFRDISTFNIQRPRWKYTSGYHCFWPGRFVTLTFSSEMTTKHCFTVTHFKYHPKFLRCILTLKVTLLLQFSLFHLQYDHAGEETDAQARDGARYCHSSTYCSTSSWVKSTKKVELLIKIFLASCLRMMRLTTSSCENDLLIV